MKRVWKPLSCGGLRLYKAQASKVYRGEWHTNEYLIMANSPSHAAQLIKERYKEVEGNWAFHGFATTVLMPEEWWIDGVPCFACKERENKLK